MMPTLNLYYSINFCYFGQILILSSAFPSRSMGIFFTTKYLFSILLISTLLLIFFFLDNFCHFIKLSLMKSILPHFYIFSLFFVLFVPTPVFLFYCELPASLFIYTFCIFFFFLLKCISDNRYFIYISVHHLFNPPHY